MEYYLPNQIKLAEYYKSLGDKAIEQLSIEELKWQPNEQSNSIAVIVKHLSGNTGQTHTLIPITRNR